MGWRAWLRRLGPWPWGLTAAVLLAYANTGSSPFIFDDQGTVLDNPHVRRLWPLGTALGAPPESPTAGRPLAALTFALNYAAGGLDVRGYHAVNGLLHLAGVLLAFGILRRTLARHPWPGAAPARAPAMAAAIALLWGLHPLLTESVTYLSQRTELLMGTALLATLYAVIRAASSSRPGRWHAAAVAACAAGMASKEVMAAAPLLVWLYDRTFLAGSARETWRRRGRLYAGLAATWGLLALLVAGDPRPQTATVRDAVVTPAAYLLTQGGVILHYLRLVLWPHPLVLSYDWPVARGVWPALPAAAAVGALVVAAAVSLRRRPAAGFLGAWVFLLLAPTSSVLPIITEIAAERRMYLPSLAVVVGVSAAAWRALQGLAAAQRARAGAALAAALLVAFGTLTVRRNAQYASAVRIWADTAARRPANAKAREFLGLALLAEGRLAEAEVQFAQDLALRPGHPAPHHNLGRLRARQGRWAEAAAAFRAALQRDPAHAKARHNLGVVLFEQGRVAEAAAEFRAAVTSDPGFVDAHHSLGLALARQGRADDAARAYGEALRLNPAYAPAHYSLAVLRQRQGRTPEAVRHLRDALRARPDFTEALASLAALQGAAGRMDQAATR
jgi:tetratricopeptide (TPR) repeat protein